MDESYIHLSYWQVGVAASLILINGAISMALGLGLHRRLLVGALRTVVQLSLVGFVLHWVFALSRWYGVLALMFAMAVIAGLAAVGRTARRDSRPRQFR